MQLEVGSIVQGKVSGIAKFGAFVDLPDGKVGMVHISEVASVYVNDINEHLKEGQEVKVKVLSIGDDGKISLSIKKAQDNAPKAKRPAGGFSQGGGGQTAAFYGGGRHGQRSHPHDGYQPQRVLQVP